MHSHIYHYTTHNEKIMAHQEMNGWKNMVYMYDKVLLIHKEENNMWYFKEIGGPI